MDSGLREAASSGNIRFNDLPTNTQNKDENNFYHYKMDSKSIGPESDIFNSVLQVSVLANRY